jgi:hypothetical protein
MKSRKACPSLLLAALLCAGACGDDDANADDTSGDNGGEIDAGAGEADAAAPDAGGDAWKTLIAGDWSLPAAQEGYWCVRLTVQKDTYIGAIRPIAPVGTHHTVLSIGAPNGADGGSSCNAATNRTQWLYASGVGTEELVLPEGVGLFVPAGQQMLLNLHLYNIQDSTLTGNSGVEIRELAAADVVHEAEVFMPGPVLFTLNDGTPTISSTCTIQAAQTVFALFPHMHKRGVHFKNEITTGGETKVIWDEAYEFENQPFALLPESMALAPGDKIKTTCSYVVQGGPVDFGDSSDDEMCFSIMMRYPRLNSSPVPYCIN